MKEELLHFVWRQRLLMNKDLKSTTGAQIQIVRPGIQNFNAGPDFLAAELTIDGVLWIGNVEMHVAASDWYAHQHEGDVNYDSVILHVVWECDMEIFTKGEVLLQCLVLKGVISKKLLRNYQVFLTKHRSWIPCEKQLASVQSIYVNHWLENLYVRRLERKATEIQQALLGSKNDFTAVFFQFCAQAFGLKVNGFAFSQWARQVDVKTLRKLQPNHEQLMAYLFGTAGMLRDKLEEPFYCFLQSEYKYLEHKFRLVEPKQYGFQFFRMRPANFPTVRMAQLSAVLHAHQQLFSRVWESETLEELYAIFQVEVHEFWDTHVSFHKTVKRQSRRLTRNFINLLVINTIIPMKFVYARFLGGDITEQLIALLRAVPAEKNTVIAKFVDLQVQANTAMESQGLLELKSEFCDKKRCLYCAIGDQILKKK